MSISSTFRTAVVLAWIAVASLLARPGTAAAEVDDPLVAPVTRLSTDGRTASDGRRSLSVSNTVLVPTGAVVEVTGAGFNEEKGLYVAFCVIPALNQLPTPCGGGIDLEGATGAARWIAATSDTPSYGAGLATPYEAGGSFSITLAVSPQINPTTDCRVVRCAVVSRNDHRRTSDRSQDVFVPITFTGADTTAAAAALAPATPTAAAISAAGPTHEVVPPGPATAVPSALVPPVQAADATPQPNVASRTAVVPEVPAVLGADGRSVTRGTAQIRIEGALALDERGGEVRATGTGFDASRGVFVALCAIPSGGGRPGPCAAGPERSAWISSQPPDYARILARPYLDGGAFDVTFRVTPVIDAKTDCRVVACAVGTRADIEGDRATDVELFVPVSFIAVPAAPAPPVEPEAASTPAPAPPATTTAAVQREPVHLVRLALVGLLATLLILAYWAIRLRRGRLGAME